jgi:transcriptional regulator with XRE-family HTH domain
MITYAEFGIEARKVMLQKGIKMRSIAEELGISVTYVSEILKGTREGAKYKGRIAEMLGMNIESG